MRIIAYTLAALPFYLLGALPTGYLLAKHYGIDISKHGSGNVGATNVSRVLGKRHGLTTLALDTAKGALAVVLAAVVSGNTDFSALAGLAAVCGHCFSIPGKLKGGKGVATALGVTLAMCPPAALIAIVVFIAILAAFRMVSLASICAALTTPTAAFFFDSPQSGQLALAAIALIVVFRHRSNLTRLSRGEEPRYSFTTSSASGPR